MHSFWVQHESCSMKSEESEFICFKNQLCWICPEVSFAPYLFSSCSATPLVHPNPTCSGNKTADLLSKRQKQIKKKQNLIKVMRDGITISLSVLLTSSENKHLNYIFSSTTWLAFSPHVVLTGKGRKSHILSQIVLTWCLKVDWNAEASEDSPFQTWPHTFCMPTTWSWSNAEPNQKRAFELPPKAIWTNLK